MEKWYIGGAVDLANTGPIMLKHTALLILLLVFPSFVSAQQTTQILNSNLYCEVDFVGSRVLLQGSDGTFTALTFEDAVSLVKSEIAKISKSIRATKAAIRKGINVARNSKKLKRLNGTKRFWGAVTNEISLCSLAAPLPIPVPAPTTVFFGRIGIISFPLLEGGAIWAQNGQFLGNFSRNSFAPTSIGNFFGSYGSDFTPNSIFNDFGLYGSDFSVQSPWNQFAFNPPIIILDGVAVAYLTVNQFKTPRVDPNDLLVWLGRGR